MNLSNALRTAKSVITANSPVLLVGTAIAGVVTTGVLAAKGGYKARGIIDEERMKRVSSPEPPFDTFLEYQEEFLKSAPEIPLPEKVKLTWLCYAAPAVTGASTIASAVGVHTIHTKRHAALAGLYAVTTGKLDDYREQAEELLGSKKTQQLNDAVAQRSADNREFENSEVIIAGGTELMLDDWSGRYFYSSVPEVEKAVAAVNMQLVETGDCSMNEYYDKLGLSPIKMGDRFGWSGAKIEPKFGSAKTPDGSRAAVVVWFQQEPKSILGTH